MATITTDTLLDDGTTRTVGEAWTINSGAKLVIKSDTRRHAGALTGMTASLGSITVNEGEVLFDGTNVRWLQYYSGSGNAPAIGTSITQGGVVSSYFLGAYPSLTSAPTNTGAAIATNGYIKFREVTGSFSQGSLTGITATASSSDVTGWIEIVCDSAANITIPRLGKHTITGSWFYLDNTNGELGQVIQTPTNGGGAGTRSPGLWIESSSNSNVYEFWPALSGSTNGWSALHIGSPSGSQDQRKNFVKEIGSGQLQIGELYTLSATYANISAQSSTYASIAHSSTYTWASDIVTVTYTTGHLLSTGQQVHLDFTSGGATANDGTYTVTVLDAFTYTVPLAGSGTSGNVTARPGHTITFTAHTLGVGDNIYFDFTTGTGVDGTYRIYAVTSANAYLIEAPHATTTSGNVSVYSRLQITYASHGLAVGNQVYLDFTSGTGVDGIYTIVEVATNTFNIVYSHNGAMSGNVTIRMIIGNIPPTNCKIRIPNVILRECATATRASNMVNATIATRPEWTVTSAGALEINDSYSTWYYNINQPYQVIIKNVALLDTLVITECATALDLDNIGIGMVGALDVRAIQLTSNFAGGTLSNIKAQRGNAPATTDHSIEVLYCKGQIFNNVTTGIIQFARSTGKAIQLNYCSNLTFNNCRIFNSDFNITASFYITINGLDVCDRYMGYTNATTAYYSVNINTKSDNIIVNGLTYGFSGLVLNVHSYSGIVYVAASSNIKVRNIGTYNNMISGGSWRPNLYGLAYIYVTGGNNDTVKLQRIYVDKVRTLNLSTINSDKNMTYESLYCGIYVWGAMAITTNLIADLNSIYKGFYVGQNTTTGQTSQYGLHYGDMFLGPYTGRFILHMNEPTVETTTQLTMISGSSKFNSVGGILMPTSGSYIGIWEDSIYRKGHTAFKSEVPVMSGGTIGNYILEYQVDSGSGYPETWYSASAENLGTLQFEPTTGFKLKLKISTRNNNTNAITYLRFNTISTPAAQSSSLYDLDTNILELTGLITGSEIRAYVGTDPVTATEIGGIESSNSTFSFVHSSGGQSGFIVIHSLGYQYYKLNYTYESDDVSIPIQQILDRQYQNN